MTTWANKYSPPVPQEAVITEHRPGDKIAKAIQEIQDKAITDATSSIDGLEVTVADGTLTISGGAGAPADEKSITKNDDGKMALKGLADATPGMPYQKISESGECGFDWLRSHD